MAGAVKDQLLEAAGGRKFFVGIDPGASGGIAVLHKHMGVIHALPMPKTERDIWLEFEGFFEGYGRDYDPGMGFALIEKVHAMTKIDPRTKKRIVQGVSSTFKFGQNYGFLRACLIASGIPFEDILPRDWLKIVGVPKREKTETKVEFKNRHKAKAQGLFPTIPKVTHAIADALLIAEACRRMRG